MTKQIQILKVALYITITMSLFSNAQCQLVIKNDAFSNSYSFATPSFQQSFTRYFGGENNANLQQIQPTQQSFSPLQKFKVSSLSKQHQFTNQDLSNILQQQRMENFLRQQYVRSTYEKQAATDTTYELNQPLYSSNMATDHNIMKFHYSPSNEVSSVKFQSNGLNYNF